MFEAEKAILRPTLRLIHPILLEAATHIIFSFPLEQHAYISNSISRSIENKK